MSIAIAVTIFPRIPISVCFQVKVCHKRNLCAWFEWQSFLSKDYCSRIWEETDTVMLGSSSLFLISLFHSSSSQQPVLLMQPQTLRHMQRQKTSAALLPLPTPSTWGTSLPRFSASSNLSSHINASEVLGLTFFWFSTTPFFRPLLPQCLRLCKVLFLLFL